MGCDNKKEKLIIELLNGELNPVREMALKSHLSRCAECRSEYEDLQGVWDRCLELSGEPAGDDLKARVARALPAHMISVHRVTLKEVLVMRKKVLALFAVLVVAVTGLVASQYMGGSSRGCGYVDGRKWSFTSSFQGQVKFLNPDGRPVKSGGVVTTVSGDPTKGQVSLTVEGKDYVFSGVGNHEVRDPQTGKLLGYVSMKPATKQILQEMQQRIATGSSGGVTGTRDGVKGFDKVLGINWEMHGSGKVTVEAAEGVKAGMPRGTGMSFNTSAPKVPELIVNVGSQKIVKQGYGRYEIPDGAGKTVMTITIEPFNPQN